MVSAAALVRWLRQHDHIAPRDITRGAMRVESLPARHIAFRVTSTTGRRLFAKALGATNGWAPAPPTDGGPPLEPRIYTHLREDAAWRGLGPHAMALRAWDSRDRVLLLELGDPLPEPSGRDPAGLGRLGHVLGRALAALHAVPAAALRASGVLPSDAPWPFALDRPIPDDLRFAAPSFLAIVRAVQADADTCRALARLRRCWHADALIHADLKLANLVLGTQTPSGEGHLMPAIRLVDWETARWGDRAWDLGGAMRLFVSIGLLDASAWDADDAEAAIAATTAMLPGVWAGVGGLLTAYAEASGATPAAQATLVRRAVAHTGVGLLQSAVEWSQQEGALARHATLALQLALNILRAPDAAAHALFGIAGPAT